MFTLSNLKLYIAETGPDLQLFFILFLLGVSFGSFFCMAVSRWPKVMAAKSKGESWINPLLPSSKCDSCGHEIRWYENIPVISYLFLKGKCSSCKTQIPWEYPFIEIMFGLIFIAPYAILCIVSLR